MIGRRDDGGAGQGEQAIFRTDENPRRIRFARAFQQFGDGLLVFEIVQQLPDAFEIAQSGFVQQVGLPAHDQHGPIGAVGRPNREAAADKILRRTVDGFNAACQPGDFHPTELDGLRTHGLNIPKTNWARPIDTPPFCGYQLRPGVTFTYLGLKVDARAQVHTPAGPIRNLWAAGEIMAGSILGQGYLAGFGMTIGTVFGRIAGKEAAAHVA